MNYIKYVLEALDEVGGIRAGYKSLAIDLGTKVVTIEYRHGKDDLRVYTWGGYQRYWPSVPSEDKRKIGKRCKEILEWKKKEKEEYGVAGIGGEEV